ncbi:hypothetical protein GALL_308620 [mine drainage metagenome]|jgi:hypothetical protein|uniref:Uncharacterized protein n=1 Tax=mine drainage metagenome TaxID=410659 RepID=A0A1J5RGQ6_9ZZZZ
MTDERSLPQDAKNADLAALGKTLQLGMGEILSSYTKIAQQYRATFANWSAGAHQVDAWLKSISVQFSMAAKAMAPVLAQIQPVIYKLASEFEKLPPRIKQAVLTLGEVGWYLDEDMSIPVIWDLEKLLRDGNRGEVDDALERYFGDRLTEIEERLCSSLPKRGKILVAAFAAHRRGEFELSIPVLLAQADGVCVDFTGQFFFVKERSKKRPRTAQYAEKLGSAFSASILSPLLTPLPINENEPERNSRLARTGAQTWSELNRHLVLHGESVDYGTRQNSLKAVSLLNYLVSFLTAVGDETHLEDV